MLRRNGLRYDRILPCGIDFSWRVFAAVLTYFQGSNLGSLRLPGKTFFKDLKEDFLEKRRAELNQYLTTILSAEHPVKAMECLHTFLDAKAYQKTSRTFASKVSHKGAVPIFRLI